MSVRFAIILSHPVQYYSPWFRHLAARVTLKVFYLWDFGVTKTRDRTFGESFVWDVPLLDGYEHEFIANQSRDPGTHHFGGLNNPGAVEALRVWKPDAILIFGYNYRTQLRLILSPKLRGIPMFFRGDSHELDPATGWKSRLGREGRKLLFRRFAAFLAVGQANADYFRASGVAESKIVHVPHCVDNARFQAAETEARVQACEWRRELGIPDDRMVFLFAGKFEGKKRPLDLLMAFLEIPEETRGKAVLLMVGSGELERELKQVAQGASDVFFAGFQNQTQMPKVYATGDVLVLPSQGRGETWGLAVNEAFNLGVPAIVSSHVGCGPDLVEDGVTGWRFEAGNPEALSKVLVQAIHAGHDLEAMGENARERVDRYSYAEAGKALVELIQQP